MPQAPNPEASAYLAAIVEYSNDAVISKDLNGRITSWNKAAERIYGYSAEEMIGKPVLTIIPPERVEEETMILDRIRRGERVEHLETIRVSKDGARLNICLTVSPIRNARGEIIGASAVARDVTRRVQTEEALRRSAAEFRALFELSAAGVAQADTNGRLFRVNRKYCRMLGYREDELLQKTVLEITHPDDHAENKRLFQQVLAGELTDFTFEKRYLHKEGHVVWVEAAVTLVRDSEGKPASWVAVMLDITRRKQAEEALRQSEQRYQIAVRATSDAFWDWDLLTNVLLWNEGMQTLFGYDAEQVRPDIFWWEEHLHPEDRDRVVHSIHGVIDGGGIFWRDEYRFLRKDGEYAEILDRGYVVRDEAGKAVRMVGAMQDLTERKRAEEQLRRNHNTFYHLIQNNPFGVYVVDADFRLRQVSLGAQKVFANVRPLLGRDFAEVLRSIWAEPFASQTMARFRHTLQTGEPYNAPSTIERRQDIEAAEAYDWRIERIILPDGRFGVVCYFYDLSERQRWEAALRESEERFRAVADNIPQMAWMTNAAGEIIWLNRRWYEYTGTTFEQMQLRGWRIVHHTRHVERVFAGWRRALAEGQPWEDTFPLRDKHGRYRWFLSRARPIRNIAGQVVRWFGTNTDVTEFRETEEALHLAVQRFETLANAMPQIVWSTRPDGYHDYFNDRWYEFTGMPREEGQGWNWKDYLHPDDVASTLEIWHRSLATGEPYDVQYRFRRARDGAYRWFIGRALPIRDREGAITRWFGTCTEITEMLETQQALREAKEEAERRRAEQQAIVNSMTEAVAIFDARGNLLDMNPAGLAMHGFESVAEMRRVRAFEEIFELRDLHGTLVPVEKWPISRLLRGEVVGPVEMRVSRCDTGKYFIGSYAAAPVPDPEGNIILGVVTVRDVTEQREAEQALAEAKAQLERHARDLEKIVAERTAKLHETIHELEAFSYSLSHDMRAPLRAMKGFSQILESEYGPKLDPEANVYLGKISRASGRLDQLIQDVLTYSRIVRESIELQPIDIEKLAAQLMEENPALQPPHAEITIDSPLHTVLGHEAYLMQVLSNLVYNAVKFVAPGRQPRIRMWTESLDSHVRLFIEDNGIGIPPEAQERMFGMFERLHHEHAYEGTGIGLTIVRKAVERMGGRVGVESEVGKGSRFWVDLRKP
jgi:PAS domain S-box-containing protein